MSDGRHPIFRQFPISSHVTIDQKEYPIPYHVYDGSGLMIGGTADFDAVQSLLADQDVFVIKTVLGRAFIGIWVMDFTDASLGAHLELQISVFVSREELPPVTDHPFALLKLLITDPAPRMMCHGLWNDQHDVVVYNTQLLGLPARRCQGSIQRDTTRHRKHFTFTDIQTGNTILTGDVSESPNPAPATLFSMMGHFGFSNMVRLSTMKVLSVQVVNPIGSVIPHNADAQTYSAADKIVVQQFAPETDSVDLCVQPYSEISFQPQFLEHFTGLKFIYLNPHNVGLVPRV